MRHCVPKGWGCETHFSHKIKDRLVSHHVSREGSASICNHFFPLHRRLHHRGVNRLDAPKICSILFLFRWSEHKRHFLSTWLFHGGQCPLSKIGVCACKIICRAALSALMRCHLPSLIAPPPMLITYNCPRAGWLLVFPDGDVLVKRFHMILTFPSNRGHHEVSFFCLST